MSRVGAVVRALASHQFWPGKKKIFPGFSGFPLSPYAKNLIRFVVIQFDLSSSQLVK